MRIRNPRCGTGAATSPDAARLWGSAQGGGLSPRNRPPANLRSARTVSLFPGQMVVSPRKGPFCVPGRPPGRPPGC